VDGADSRGSFLVLTRNDPFYPRHQRSINPYTYMKNTLMPVQPGLLDIDGETFRAGFNRAPFLIGHHLAGHPLFSLQRLVELASRLPEEKVKYNGADISVATLPEPARARGAPAHWLGHVGVADVDATADRIVALGGEQLGPRRDRAIRRTKGLPPTPNGSPIWR